MNHHQLYHFPFTHSLIDNVRLWKILVEPTMVVDIANLGASLTSPSVEATWMLDEGQGDFAFDLIQKAVVVLPPAPWSAPSWVPSDQTDTLEAATAPLVYYFRNATLQGEAETLCATITNTVGSSGTCSSVSEASKSFFKLQVREREGMDCQTHRQTR